MATVTGILNLECEMNRRKQAGFTLIEVVVAVAIVGILASIAYPSYTETMRKSRRADAKVVLTDAAAREERWFTENNAYTTNVNNLGGSGGTLYSEEGYYNITVSNAACGDTSCFMLTATPVAGGVQVSDTDCATLTLSHTGAKGSTGGGNCW